MMDEARCRALLAAERVARLATVRPDGAPHVVVCCYAVQGDRVWTAIDAKPKSGARLQRLENVRANPRASLLVDHYEEDWSQLWWVRLRGTARVLEDGAEHDRALSLLAAKYEQYRSEPPPGPVIAVRLTEWRGWSASPEAFGDDPRGVP